MSKKRKRDGTVVDVELFKLYEGLADESEDTRLSAANSLMQRLLGPEKVDADQIKTVLMRLCRGLCSSRKAARLGFSVALTELLSQLQNLHTGAAAQGLSASEVVDVLEGETNAEGNTSGQDERDHFFGRLFGAGAIINSGFLFTKQDLTQWRRLLDLLCGIALKKPWLRQECGWILCNNVRYSMVEPDLQDFAVDILERFEHHKLIRTPEGVALWLVVQKQFPHAKLPKHVWKHRDPLARKGLPSLADVLKDARSQSAGNGDGFESQGSTMWTAQLHFVWNVVLSELYLKSPSSGNGAQDKHHDKRISLQDFWEAVVDESLFAASSSPERKHWGFLLLSKTLVEAPPDHVSYTFSKNAVSCLIHALKGDDRYLKRSAQKALQTLDTLLRENATLKPACFKALLEASSFADFDAITKTKTFEKMLTPDDCSNSLAISSELYKLLKHPESNDRAEAIRRRKVIANLQAKLFELMISHAKKTSDPEGFNETSRLCVLVSSSILSSWINESFFDTDAAHEALPAFERESRDYMKTRLTNALELGLKSGRIGAKLLHVAVADFAINERLGRPCLMQFDDNVKETVRKAWPRLLEQASPLDRHDEQNSGDDTSDGERSQSRSVLKSATDAEDATKETGLALLYSLTMFQVYNGDPEAVEVLEDLLAYHESEDQRLPMTEEENGSDAIVEILLSFASKPSKFLRRIVLQIFEIYTSHITSRGLESLTRVLAAKETAQGQQEMFEAHASDEENDIDGADDSDAQLISSNVESDSDVETSTSASGEVAEETDGNQEEEDDEVAEFERKLAVALGTRRGDEDLRSGDTSGSSDTEMDDDQMMALDQKLVEVFRTRKQATSKKKEQRDAKENIVMFKNRVVDLIDVYLKHEHLSPQSLDLILPLLQLARKTNTRQLAERACSTLKDFCSRCKGQNVPALRINEEEGLEEATQILKAIHSEAGLEGSNARAAACSSASVLVVKTLINGGADLRHIIDIYSDTRERQLTDKNCKIQPAFFTDWNNWCAQAKNQLAS